MDACCKAAPDNPFEDAPGADLTLAVAESMDDFVKAIWATPDWVDAIVEVERARSLRLQWLQRSATTRCMRLKDETVHGREDCGGEVAGIVRIP